MRQSFGFTLVETLIALAVGAVLATLAVNGFRHAMMAGYAAAERSALTETLLTALNQSTISGKKVVLCASLDGDTCGGGLDWSSGWIAFVDESNDREHDVGEPIVRVHHRLKSGIRLRTSTGRTRIVFQPFGGVNDGSNVTFTFCDSRGAAKASTIILANTGRMRSAPATPAQAGACLGMS